MAAVKADEANPAADAAARSATRHARPALALAALALIGLGAWTSLRYTLSVWGPDPDVMMPIFIWQGVHAHGLGFLRSWAYTPDNWLLSLLPLTSLVFEIFGAHAELMPWLGWLIFMALVALTAGLAWRIAGWRAGLALACVLPFASVRALGDWGLFAFPVTHNISLAWGLAALWLAVEGLERRGFAPIAAAAVCVFVGAASDPWAEVAIAAPMLVAALALALKRAGDRGVRRRCGLLAGLAGLALLLAHTRLFGLLDFLPTGQLTFAGAAGISGNADAAGLAMANLFNVVPWADPSKHVVRYLDNAALALALVSGAGLAIAASRNARPGAQLAILMAALSIPATLAVYLVEAWAPGQSIGRFFVNVYFFGGLLLATGAARLWPGLPAQAKFAIASCPIALAAAGLASQPSFWLGPQPAQPEARAHTLAAMLASHGLTHGYGAYWGARANEMQWASGGRVIERPVVFQAGRVRRRLAETSSYWYLASDAPRGARDFLIVTPADEDHQCPDRAACITAAIAQFGPPAERFAVGGDDVLIWNRSIGPQIDP